jgi:molybdopterin-guanine dinucleotide biosynthesis protein A
MTTLAAVLLAGGESRRMGRDKAMLLVDGIPLWQRQLGLLRELSPCALLVSAREVPGWLPADARFIADSEPGRGPLGGLAAVLEVMRATHLLALAIDLPAMSAGHLAGLWVAAAPGCGVLPWLGGRAEPLPAIYPVEAGPIARGMLSGEDVSLRALTQALLAAGRMKKRVIRSPEANLYANWNSPGDWQQSAQSEPNHD